MKRDVQVGVILGVIILAIIGVFLSTRTAVKEPNIPIPEIEDEYSQVGVLDMSKLPQEPPGESRIQTSFKEAVTTAENTGKKEQVAIPAAKEKTPVQSTVAADNVIEGEWKKAKDVIVNNQKTPKAPDSEEWKSISPDNAEKYSSKFQIHKVQYKDDLHKIAKKYYGDVSKWILIFNANKDKIQDRNSLKIGTDLIIPVMAEGTSASESRNTEMVIPALSHVTEVEETTITVKKHVVQQGDTLSKIASKYYNDSTKWNKILDNNRKILKNQNSLKIGQELTIPDL